MENSGSAGSIVNDPARAVQASLEKFLAEKGMTQDKLTKEQFAQWDFIKDLEVDNKFNLNDSTVLSSIPWLDNSKVQEGKLVKFSCMVQNVLENQIYMAAGSSENKSFVNKYFECTAENLKGDDLLDEFQFENQILCERLVLNVVPIPGLNFHLREKFSIKEEIYKKKIILYDYEDKTHKINQEILVIGVLYRMNDCLLLHAWKITENFVSSIESAKSDTSLDFPSIKSRLKNYLSSMFADELIAEYVILFLCSQTFYKFGTHLIGKFSLNITNQQPAAENFYKNFIEMIAKITNFSVAHTLTIEKMNQELFYSKFDVESEELKQGILQLCDYTFVILDERQMAEGKLNERGLKNYTSIKKLIDAQRIEFEYPYSSVEIEEDLPILTITDKIKSIFHSDGIISVPVTASEAFSIPQDKNEYEEFRGWFNSCRSEERFTKKFLVEKSISEKIQKDSIGQKDFSAESLDTMMKLARLFAISEGRDSMKYEDYLFVKELERKRKDRLSKTLK